MKYESSGNTWRYLNTSETYRKFLWIYDVCYTKAYEILLALQWNADYHGYVDKVCN